MPVLKSLEITEQIIANRIIKEAIAKTRQQVTDGKTIAEPLARSKVFPQLMVDLVKIGEETGDVPGSLANLAETYEGELDIALRVMTNMIEPVIICVMAMRRRLPARRRAFRPLRHHFQHHRAMKPGRPFPRGFTLIEVMMVVAIIGLTLTMGLPAFLRVLKREGMRKAEYEMVEACTEARRAAIMNNQKTTWSSIRWTGHLRGSRRLSPRHNCPATLPSTFWA